MNILLFLLFSYVSEKNGIDFVFIFNLKRKKRLFAL